MITKRLARLRSLMQQKGIQAYYINGSDPHLSEYLPDRWQTRAFISGFTGSFGWLCITLKKAALWTDSRYFLQAEEQLKGTSIQLMKLRQTETPTIINWLISQLSPDEKVGINSECISFSLYKKMQTAFEKHQIELKETGDLLNKIWENRPEIPNGTIKDFNIEYAGENRQSKLFRIREQMQNKNIELQILSALDDIAWTFNLRGCDIDFNPVFLSYALIDKKNAHLFVNTKSISKDLKNELKKDSIELHPYDKITNFLENIPENTSILLDPDKTNYSVISSLPKSCKIVEELSTPCLLKSQKNQTEINNLRQAMIKDGLAMTDLLFWLENTVGKQPLTEYDVAMQLSKVRSKQALYCGDSFFPIVGYQSNGAIVHYHVEKATALSIKKEGLLLFDSGAHYQNGTTDITRTVSLGTPTDQQKTDFTLVLKGMIALSQAVFPVNTKGYHLDILARKALWQHGLNYGHGTGHGVGFFLNVHEGPMSIRMDNNEQSIKAGQVLSNEPGVYKTGEYGIRTENMMVCTEKQNTDYGNFLGFETLTLCPIDTQLIALNLLSEKEIYWLNKYHQMVFEKLSPLLNDELRSFLKRKTKRI